METEIESQSTEIENKPRPFGEIPGLWLKLSHMTVDFFRKELPHTSTSNTLLWILIYAVIATILNFVQTILAGIINASAHVSGAQADAATGIFRGATFLTSCLTIIVIPLGFYLINSITFLCAKVFRGTGAFSSQAYLNSLFYIPLGLITLVVTYLDFVPTIGYLLVVMVIFVVGILQLIYTIRMFEAVHNFSQGRAVIVFFTPFLLLLIQLCIIGVLMLMGPMIGNVFSSINSQLISPVP